MHDYSQYHHMPERKIHDIFLDACERGDVELVSYICTNPNMRHQPLQIDYDCTGWFSACYNNHSELLAVLAKVPFFLMGIETPVAYMEYVFKDTYENGYFQAIAQMVMELDIPLDEEMAQFINDKPELSSLFEKRNLNRQLHEKMIPSTETLKRAKL